MKDLTFDIAADTPPTVDGVEAALMVQESALDRHSFSDDAGYLQLGIGAEVADDYEGFSGGIALKQQEGFVVA